MQILMLLVVVAAFLIGFSAFLIGVVKTPMYSSRKLGLMLMTIGIIVLGIGLYILISMPIEMNLTGK